MNQDLHRTDPCQRPSIVRVLPVIDLRAGRPVHARGGDRRSYPPVESILYRGDDPIGLPLAFRDVLGLHEFYLADLDAIGGSPPDLAFLRRAAEEGLGVWIDAGLRDTSWVEALFAAGARSLIAATETLAGPAELDAIRNAAPAGSIVFGLDLNGGRPVVARQSSWRSLEPAALIDEALRAGIRRVLILDTARIGSGGGVGTLPLVRALLRQAPEIEVIVGGGIAGFGDLRSLDELGVSAALVGSALHDGRIGVANLRALNVPSRAVDG